MAVSYHVLRVAVAFAIIGLFCLLVAFVAVPLSALLRPGEGRDLRAQRILARSFAAYEAVARALGLIGVEWIGAERLRGPGPMLIVSNHPTLIDVVLLGASLTQMDCIVSAAWAKNPFLGGVIRAAGYICDDTGPAVVDEAERRLRQGRNVLVFPEGTRSPETGLGRFQRGAAHIALRGGWDLVPVTIRCEPRILMKGQKWYDLAHRRARFVMRVEEPIRSKPFLDTGETRSIEARRLTAALRDHYEARLNRVEC